MFGIKAKSKSGYTLVEMLVVIAIMVLMTAIAIPFDLSYRKKSELKQTTKQLRGLFWEAQDLSLAPRSQYATSYKINLIKDSSPAGRGITVNIFECLIVPPATTETCTIVPGIENNVIFGTNIMIEDIQLDGVSTALPTKASFLVGNGNNSGKISFVQNGVTLSQSKMDVIIGTLLDSTLTYDIVVDGATNSITYK